MGIRRSVSQRVVAREPGRSQYDGRPERGYSRRRLRRRSSCESRIGHAAIDGSFGYTYFNPQTGYEFSALAGATYNYENDDTQYQNGIDGHIDWGWSKFLPTQMQVGIAGYVFQQLTGDDGEGATLGDFKSQVVGIGPQIGKLYSLWGMQAYANVRGYYEFAAKNRAEGWNVYITFGLSPAGKQN